MSQKKSSDHDEHCRLVAERLGKPLDVVKQVIGHYYGGVNRLTTLKLGTRFILPELGALVFNTRNTDYPIRRLEKRLFFYANIYTHKTVITNKHGKRIFNSRIQVRHALTNYMRQYLYFISCILDRFLEKYAKNEGRHWHKTFGNYEKAPFNLAVILGNIFRLEQIIGVPVSLTLIQEGDRLTKKALRFMLKANLLDKFKNLEPPFSLYSDLREVWLCATSKDSKPEEQVSS